MTKPSKRSLRSTRTSSQANQKDKSPIFTKQDPQPREEPPSSIQLLPEPSEQPPGPHPRDGPPDISCLEPSMGPPPPPLIERGRRGRPGDQPNPPLPPSPSESSEEEQEPDVSPESSLLPVFREVTRYPEGTRKVCFVNFDRYPGPARPGLTSEAEPSVKIEVESDLGVDDSIPYGGADGREC